MWENVGDSYQIFEVCVSLLMHFPFELCIYTDISGVELSVLLCQDRVRHFSTRELSRVYLQIIWGYNFPALWVAPKWPNIH